MAAQRLGEGLFAGDGSRAWLYGSAMHSDVPPVRRGSAIAAAYMNLLGHGAGWPSPEGGAGRLAGALVSYLRDLGGDGAHRRDGHEVRRASAATSWASNCRAVSGSRRRS